MEAPSEPLIQVFARSIEHLRLRPRMMVFDDRYVTQVAFICGLGIGVGEEIIFRFGKWVKATVAREPNSGHWSSIIASQVDPAVAAGRRRIGDMSAEDGASAIALMHEIFQNFLQQEIASEGTDQVSERRGLDKDH